jgi:hypothetical protein
MCTARVWISIMNKTYALEQRGIDVQEVARKDAGCLGCQELPPGGRRPARRRAEPDGSQDPLDRPSPTRHPGPISSP